MYNMVSLSYILLSLSNVNGLMAIRWQQGKLTGAITDKQLSVTSQSKLLLPLNILPQETLQISRRVLKFNLSRKSKGENCKTRMKLQKICFSTDL